MDGGQGKQSLPLCRANLGISKLFEVFCVLAGFWSFFFFLSSMNFCGMLTGDWNVGFPAALPKRAMAFG